MCQRKGRKGVMVREIFGVSEGDNRGEDGEVIWC